ncbi:MurR/RpiR family transcriptional regulator [Leuconostoc fallax]|uniref:HTH rpiR-type domain-containing protein n=1 Tax=Leuconostoc fallax TaxID=1251 RepID=A0A4R5NB15_9LACO|nr:MurR/RpiR family transcriptional regulator [Leuconostoc fallax]MBU7455033.1 MurR/RpiR family transcriptional regulator [Leuconostoc fallax]MCO6183309.1 MurR/RpiR family transcriptional regulator [Leuconostoc fallax]TDG69598.1 hypothetical protein C5L23_001060 [Leuconostoc fallax]
MPKNIVTKLRAQKKQYNPTEQKLIQYIIDDPQRAKEATIREMALGSGISTASISRFVKKIGFESFREFSLALASSSVRNITNDFFGEISDDDNTIAIAHKVFHGATNALATTEANLDGQKLDHATQALINSNRVGFFGIGGSSILAFNAYHKFLRTPLNVFAHPDYDIQLMEAVRMKKGDVGVVISHSGRNKDTLLIAQKLKENGVLMIAITAFEDAPLAKIADINFLSLAEEVNFRSESMSSLIAQVTIIDTLFTLVGSKLANQTQDVVDTLRDAIEETREK